MNMLSKKWCAPLVALFVAGTLVAAPFELLFRVMSPSGTCEVRRPGATEFSPAYKGYAYPYGSTIRSAEGAAGALIVLSDKDAIRLDPNTVVELLSDPENEQHKILRLLKGSLLTRMDVSNSDEYALIVDSPVAKSVALGGNSTFKLEETATDIILTARTDGGSAMRLIGPQFILPSLRNGYGARITTARDNSVTRIENLLGDYKILVNTGLTEDTPELIDEEPNPELISVDSNSRSVLKIWRTHARVGGRLIVSVLATYAHGKGRENFAFAVGQPNVASRSIFSDDEAAATNLLDKAVESTDAEDGDVFNTQQEETPATTEAAEFDFNAF